MLQEHATRALTEPQHMYLAAMLRQVDSQGRKSTRNAVMAKKSGSAVAVAAAAVLGYLFNYNTVEMVLLFCCCLIALCGIMFESGRYQTSAFASQRYSIQAFVVLVIMLSIIYCKHCVQLSSAIALSLSPNEHLSR